MAKFTLQTLVLTTLTFLSSLMLGIIFYPEASNMSRCAFPGDEMIPAPEMHYNHGITVRAPPSTVYPWILQLGRGRGGWYLPASWERVLPKSMHASRQINPAWTRLRVGDKVEDYGFDSKEDFFEVTDIVPNQALVYKSERYGTVFTWAILVNDLDGREGWSSVRLRFRGRIQSTGFQRRLLVFGGGWMDWATTWPMLKGLKERAERAHQQ